MTGSLRRAMGAALIAVTMVAMFEPMVGLAREGVVHHEGEAAAILHQGFATGGHHGHEDAGSTASEQEHGPQHQHGTAADHCTHAHGPALLDSWGLQIVEAFTRQSHHESAAKPGSTSSGTFHPPRA